MINRPLSSDATWAPDLAARVDRVCDQFEAVWANPGSVSCRPRIEEFLAEVAEADRSILLWELLALEVAYRLQAGEKPQVDEYLERFPSLELVELEKILLPHEGPNTPATTGPVTPPPSVPSVAQGTQRLMTIAGYEILAELGRGGMGVVYKARKAALQPFVALKLIRPEALADPIMVARFLREARAAARLSHPNIVRLYEADCVGETHFLVLEYVEGITLQRLVRELGSLQVEQACDYIRQVALGLQHAFEQGLVHRDIKPSNLMLHMGTAATPRQDESSGQRGTDSSRPPEAIVKILDFGLARLRKQAQQLVSSTSLTAKGMVLGTPDYIAPEQAEDASSADIRSDLYSLGCTFYYLLTGRVPFPDATLLEKLDKHRWEYPLPVERLRTDTSSEIAAVVRKLIAKNPEDRFQQPIEVVQALKPRVPKQSAVARAPYSAVGDLRAGRKKATAPLAGTGTSGEIRRFQAHRDLVQCVAFSSDGRLALSGGLDQRVCLWEISTGCELRRLKGSTGGVLSLSISEDGNYVLCGCGDQSVRLWAVHTGRELRRFEGHSEPVTSVAFFADGRRALSGSGDGTVRLWKVPSGQKLGRFTGHKGGVSGVALCPNQSWFLSGARDRRLYLWDIEARRQLRSVVIGTDRETSLVITSAALSSDGCWAVAGGSDGTVYVWDINARYELFRLEGHTDGVTSVAFSPDSRRILSGSTDHSVRLWDLARRCQLYCFEGHTNWVTDVAYSPDGLYALSSSADETVRLWRLPK
jgi:WD40 repeat protein/tRNA A-37 threonylcarbamoyl transferase component Bud32